LKNVSEKFLTKWFIWCRNLHENEKIYGKQGAIDLICERPLNRWVHMDGSKLSLKILLNCWSNRSNRISLQLVYCCVNYFFIIQGLCFSSTTSFFLLKLLVHKSLTKKIKWIYRVIKLGITFTKGFFICWNDSTIDKSEINAA
jgi:hypothetical protein